MYWNLIVITLCLLLLLFLIWKEVKRSNKSWLGARVVASVFAVISLACLALPVSINQQQKKNTPAIAILLTEGFDKDSVIKMVNDHQEAKVFTANKNMNAFNATYITDVTFLKEFSAVHVFGYGLDENEVRLLKDIAVVFHPALIKNYITSIDWTQKLTSGEPPVKKWHC